MVWFWSVFAFGTGITASIMAFSHYGWGILTFFLTLISMIVCWERMKK